MKKVISIILTAAFMMQSCVVYQKTPVALANIEEVEKAKVITNSGGELKFDKILKSKDEIYLGINNRGDTLSLSNELIAEIYLIDDTKSTFASVGVGSLFILFVISLVGVIGFFVFMNDWYGRMK